MIRALLALALLGACAKKPPVVTGGGSSADGRTAWFAVVRGTDLTIYRCEPEGCFVVPRGDEPARRMPSVVAEPEPAAEETEEGPPTEERLDLMDGVL